MRRTTGRVRTPEEKQEALSELLPLLDAADDLTAALSQPILEFMVSHLYAHILRLNDEIDQLWEKIER